MFNNTSARISIYLLLVILGGLVEFGFIYRASAIAYETDKSAFAWLGFLPFFFPIFFIRSFIVMLVVGLITELILFWKRIQ